MSQLLEQALKLPLAERIRLADELYMSVGGGPAGTIPLTDTQIEELERRIKDYEQNPEKTVSLEQFRARFDAR